MNRIDLPKQDFYIELIKYIEIIEVSIHHQMKYAYYGFRRKVDYE